MTAEMIILVISLIGVILMYFILIEERNNNRILCNLLHEKNQLISELEKKYIHCANCDREIKEHCEQLQLDLDFYEQKCEEAELRLEVLKSKYEILECMCPITNKDRKTI